MLFKQGHLAIPNQSLEWINKLAQREYSANQVGTIHRGVIKCGLESLNLVCWIAIGGLMDWKQSIAMHITIFTRITQ